MSIKTSLSAACFVVGLSMPAVAATQAPSHAQVAASEQRPEEKRPRSVLFYLMDTSRHDRMGYDGYARETTPFLKWLAERSVVFESCYSQAAWTKPSMASILSSQYPSKTGVYRVDHRLPAEFVTWPEVLQASGRTTAGFSANVIMGNALSNFAQGFDHFVESIDINQADPIRFASGSARKLNEHAFAWLDATDHWPMLLYMHSVDPHEEYEPEPDYLKLFADPARHASFRLEWQKLLDSRPPIPGLYVTQDNFDRTQLDSASFIKHASNLYDADVRANDDQLKELWNKLQKDGWGEDIVFVFTSDHGEEFFDHGATSHGYSLYDEMVRVPLMIYAPGLLPAGKRIAEPVRSMDIYPTLCDLLGLELPEGLEGQSLLPLINGQPGADVPVVFSEHREDPVLRRMGHGSGTMVSLRSGRWKFILNNVSPQMIERPRFELFDLEQDPDELHNLAELHPELVKGFEQQVVEFVGDYRQDASAGEWATMDPAVLEQLRALGYVGDDEEVEPDLWGAVDAKDLKGVRAALAAGANPDEREEAFGVTPLAMAAMSGDLALARLLLESGASVDARNMDASTPLLGAVFLGRVDVLALLLEKGADPSAKNAQGDSAQSVAQTPWEITKYIADLLQIEVDPEQVTDGRLGCVELLSKSED